MRSCSPRRARHPGRHVVERTVGEGDEVSFGHHLRTVAVDVTPSLWHRRTSQDVVEPVQQMPHPLALGAQVGDVLGVRRGLQRDPLGDVEAEALQPSVLDRVVGHEAHGGHAEVDQHLRADAVLPAVDGESLAQVGVHRVVALLLQLVRPDFVAEADAAALVAPQVDEDAAPFLLNQVERGLQLRPAVTAQGAEHVAGQTLGVDPHQHVLGPGHLAHHECEVLLVVQHRLVDEGPELTPVGRDARLGDESHQLLVLPPVADEVRDGDEREVVLLGEGLEVGQPGHLRLVLGHDLAEHARRRQPRGAGQVDRRLGVPGSLEHATGAVAQREDVSGPVQVVRARGRVDQGRNGGGPVRGRDPGRRAVAEVHAHREGSPLRLGVGRDHEGQVERVRPLGQQRRTDDARGVGQEEGDVLRRGRLGRHDQVALVLTVLVVDHHGHAQPADRIDRLLHLRERHWTESVTHESSSHQRRRAASNMPSERVGCPWTIRASSGIPPSRQLTFATCCMSSVARVPTMWAPRMDP